MGPTPFYGARAQKPPKKADFAMKQTNICRLSGDINEGCNSCAGLAGLVLCFIVCFILLVIAPLMIAVRLCLSACVGKKADANTVSCFSTSPPTDRRMDGVVGPDRIRR